MRKANTKEQGTDAMKHLTLILFLGINFSANAAGIAVSAGVSIGKATCSACCLPFIKWCAGSIHDALQTDEEREKQEKINSIIENPPLQEGLAKWHLTNCQVTFVGESVAPERKHIPDSKREDMLVLQDPPPHKIDFQHELQVLIKKTLDNKEFKILSLELGSLVHALVFRHDESYPIFTINGAVRTPDSKIFDSLFGDRTLSKAEKKERDLLRKCINSLNTVLKKTEEYADGLYLTVSGRKFYRIGTTHIVPILHDEIHAITQQVTHRRASFGKVTKKIDDIVIPEELEMLEMGLGSSSLSPNKEESKHDDDSSSISLRVNTPSPSLTLEHEEVL